MNNKFHSLHLPVAYSSEFFLFDAKQNRVAWPLRSYSDRNVLESIAKIFGAQLVDVVDVDVVDGGEECQESYGEVVATSDSLVPSAQLYAWLTQRHFRGVYTPKQLANNTPDLPDIVLADPSAFGAELFDVLYMHEEKRVPGIILGQPGDKLHKQILVRSAASRLYGPLNLRSLEYSPMDETQSVWQCNCGTRVRIGGASDPSKFWRYMDLSPGLLAIETHSDGIDAPLAAGQILCPMDKSMVDRDVQANRTPYCIHVGICQRTDRSIADARDEDILIPTSKLGARILLWNVCYGALDSHAPIDLKWSLLWRMVSTLSLGSIITTRDLNVTSPERYLDFLSELSSGEQVGSAVAKYNCTNSLQASERLILLGDPMVRLPAETDCLVCNAAKYSIQSKFALQRSNQKFADMQYGDLGLLRCLMYLAISKTNNGNNTDHERAVTTLSAVQTYEFLISLGLSNTTAEKEAGKQLCDAIVDYLSQDVRICSYWTGAFGMKNDITETTTCRNCGHNASRQIWQLRIPFAEPRRVVSCPRCSVTEDAPANASLGMHISNDYHVKLTGSFEFELWSATLLIWHQNAHKGKRVTWPANANSYPASSLDISEFVGSAPCYVSIIIAWNTSVAILTVHIPGLATNTEGVLEKD